MKSFLLCLLILTSHIFSSAQTTKKYWVFFTNKAEQTFDPYRYFDAKAIQRRIANNIPLCDSTDFPVNGSYINKINQLADSVCNTTRWLNGITIIAKPQAIEQIQNLPFVKDIVEINAHLLPCNYTTDTTNTLLDSTQQNILENQINSLEGIYFTSAGINGKGVRIAILDAGFPNVDKHPAFEHIRKNNNIIATWDFVKQKPHVYDFNQHGTMVMSCIGGKYNNKLIGLATDAEFLLARTEVESEPFSEEENWLLAAEWADKNGADIINSSLGYTYHRYFPWNMDGKYSFISKAANLAAKKGILVVNAAGNDGNNNWKYISTPADADSVLTVGGIDPWTNTHTDFSSFGPTADKRLKPNVCAFGHVIAASPINKYEKTQGTSFASPLVAGFAACVKQIKGDSITNMQLFKELEKSSNLYPYFDYAHGYGMPQASYFVKDKKSLPNNTFNINVIDDSVTLQIIEPNKINTSDSLIYYHIENNKGFLESYYLIIAESKEPLKIPVNAYPKGYILRVHYQGNTKSYYF